MVSVSVFDDDVVMVGADLGRVNNGDMKKIDNYIGIPSTQ